MTRPIRRRVPERRNLLRYIHTQSYSRLAGFRAVKTDRHLPRNRAILLFIGLTALAIGLRFVFF